MSKLKTFKIAMLAVFISTSATQAFSANNDLDLSDGASQNFCFTSQCKKCEATKKESPTLADYDIKNVYEGVSFLAQKFVRPQDLKAVQSKDLNVVRKTLDKITAELVNNLRKDIASSRSSCYGKTLAKNTLPTLVARALMVDVDFGAKMNKEYLDRLKALEKIKNDNILKEQVEKEQKRRGLTGNK